MSETDKFIGLLGFAKRAGKIVYGYDELRSAKRIKLLVVGDSASNNVLDGLKKIAAKNGVTLVKAERLEELVGGNCKALGITDKNMASGMLDYIRGEQSWYSIISVEDRIG